MGATTPAADDPAPVMATLTETIPGSTVTIELARIPAGAPFEPSGTAVGNHGGRELGGFWMSRTEVTWDAFDIFVYGLGVEAVGHTGGPLPERQREVDGITRPSKPFIMVDRGFGHAGHPAMSMSLAAAQDFCTWLSAVTGRHYRLPTEAEWEYACVTGGQVPDESEPDHDWLQSRAWYHKNARRGTRPVGTLTPDSHGLFDLLGNVGEWCSTPDGAGVVKGGSFRDRLSKVSHTARAVPDPSWNARDPQIPKSRWWLTDGEFVGFRLVCEDLPEAPAPTAEGNEADPTRDSR